MTLLDWYGDAVVQERIRPSPSTPLAQFGRLEYGDEAEAFLLIHNGGQPGTVHPDLRRWRQSLLSPTPLSVSLLAEGGRRPGRDDSGL